MSAFATGSTGFEKFAGRGVALAPPQRPETSSTGSKRHG